MTLVIGGNCRIGVLGGIGPEATGEFYNKLIAKFQESGLIKSNRNFPQIVINSIPAPELIYDIISDEDLEPYIIGLRELDKFGVDFIVMICNTIYLFYDKLQEEIKTPILNLREELRRLLTDRKIKSITVLGTPNTIKKGLYKFEGTNSIDLSEDEMKRLTEAVFRFNKGVDKAKQIQIVKTIARKYLDKGAETIILGCTEQAVMLKDENISKIDTIDVFAEATVNKFLNKRHHVRLQK